MGPGVARLEGQLAADLGGTQPGVEPAGVEGGVGLGLGIDDGADVVEEAGEMVLGPLAPARRERVEAPDTGVESFSRLYEEDMAISVDGHVSEPSFVFWWT